jgi:Mn-dependent DtxR family transcriptional regulator
MSIQQYRLRLQRVIYLIKHHQFQNTTQAARILRCHPSTVKRIIERLRLEGYRISYEKVLKRYVLEEDEL